jgi:hypothetical protein
MTDEALIEELARVLDAFNPDQVDHELCLRQARAILPIIQRERVSAGEAVKEAAAKEADVNAHEECEVAEQIAKWIRDLNVEAIVGGGE